MKNSLLGIIPARYASTRFPGKPLTLIHGKTMIQRVFEQASKAQTLEAVYIATDDRRIFENVKGFTTQVVMTGEEHPNGTSRCLEALEAIEMQTNKSYDVVLNIQGDEPYIDPDQIDTLAGLFNSDTVEIGTLAKRIDQLSQLMDPNVVKLVYGTNKQAHYFSRNPIPFIRDLDKDQWMDQHKFYKHIGIYAYRASVLRKITSLDPTALEQAEKLEQLRWLENGHQIYVEITDLESIAIDSPEDLEKLMNKT